ncbi:MAG: metal-sensitive transcriptional regulator [Coriobacteriia bacterium]|nr:metal-sensitive transcriptional regulator [Coriobacteriia bacterium]
MADNVSDHPNVVTSEIERKKIINRLRRLEGQIRGLQTMVESEKDCASVLTQVMAAKSALNQVGVHIISHSMRECLTEAEVGTASHDEAIDRAISVFLKYSS